MVRQNKQILYKITAFFVALGLIYILFGSANYESEALLMPEMKGAQSQAGSLLKNYGSMLGLGDVNQMEMREEGTILPMVYPQIVQSLSFQNELMKRDFYFSNLDTTVSGYDYFENVRSLSFFELIEEYTLKLPSKIFGPAQVRLPEELRDELSRGELIQLDEQQLEAVKDMRDRVFIELDSETGVLSVSVEMPDPVAAAHVCRAMIDILKGYLKEYSTQKAKQDLEFAEKKHQQAQQRFEEAQSALAKFRDKNINLSTARAQTQQQRLEAEYDLAYSLYNSVSQTLMKAQMRVQEQTPVFKELQSANVPLHTSGPGALIILILSAIAGGLVSFFYIAGRNVYENLKAKI